MISIFKSTKAIIGQIEEFLDLVDESGLVYKKGVRFYLKGEHEEFVKSMEQADGMEGRADDVRRDIEDVLYRKSLLPELRGDVLQLLERLDDILDTIKENLIQFEVESPLIPDSIHGSFLELTETSSKAIESVVLSARAFFREPKSVKDMLHRVYFYEKEGDSFSNKIKRKVYKEMDELNLAQKNHVRHFIDKAEHLSDVAEDIADLLALLSIKRTV